MAYMERQVELAVQSKAHIEARAERVSWRKAYTEAPAAAVVWRAPSQALLLDRAAEVREICLRW